MHRRREALARSSTALAHSTTTGADGATVVLTPKHWMDDVAMVRIPPLDPPYAPDVASQLESMMPPGAPPIDLFRTFAKNLPMTVAMSGWGRYELGRQLSLTMREREI